MFEFVDLIECRLRRRRQHDACAVVRSELAQTVEDGREQARRQRLGLVEDDDAPGEVVKLARLAPAIREQALEQLHGRRDDDRRVPILGRKPLPDSGRRRAFFLFGGAAFDGGRMMLEHDPAPVPGTPLEDLPVHLGGLLGDGRERDRYHDTPHAVLDAVAQGERHRGARLAAAGRHSQPEQAGRFGRGIQARLVHLATDAIHRRVGHALLALEERFVAGPQLPECRAPSALRRRAAQRVRLRVEAIGVDERRVGETQEQLRGELVVRDMRGQTNARAAGEIRHLRAQRLQCLHRTAARAMFVEPGAVVSARIGESAVVRLDQQTDEWLAFLFGEEGPGALVIRPGAARTCPGLALHQVALPLGVRLAGVVPEAREEGEVAAAKRPCPPARKRGNVAQVVDKELALTGVIGGVSEERLNSRVLPCACIAHAYDPRRSASS